MENKLSLSLLTKKKEKLSLITLTLHWNSFCTEITLLPLSPKSQLKYHCLKSQFGKLIKEGEAESSVGWGRVSERISNSHVLFPTTNKANCVSDLWNSERRQKHRFIISSNKNPLIIHLFHSSIIHFFSPYKYITTLTFIPNN